MLLTKMWFPPVIALAGALATDRETFARWQPRWVDVPIAMWCLWPLGQWFFVANPEPQPWIAALYLAATWGVPYLLGRMYFCGNEGGRQLITAIAAGLCGTITDRIHRGCSRTQGVTAGSMSFTHSGRTVQSAISVIGLSPSSNTAISTEFG